MKIRKAREDDLEAVWKLFKAVIDQNAYYAYDHTTTRAQIETTWIHLDNIIIIAEVDKKVGGACIIKPNQPGHGAHIANAAYMVDTKLRNQGIGRALAKHALEQARLAGYRGMQYNMVLKTNLNAVHLYLDLGFEIIGTVPEAFLHFEEGYVDAHIMFKKL